MKPEDLLRGPTPETVAKFHLSQIQQILIYQADHQSIAWTASIMSGVRAMERGLIPVLMPVRTAKKVLALAVESRQQEVEQSNRWFIACIMESLATLRVLSFQDRTTAHVYQQAKRFIFGTLPPLD